MSGAIEPRALDIDAMCRRYSIGRTTVFAELKSGRLRATKVGRRTLIDLGDADAWWQGLRGPVEAITEVQP